MLILAAHNVPCRSSVTWRLTVVDERFVSHYCLRKENFMINSYILIGTNAVMTSGITRIFTQEARQTCSQKQAYRLHYRNVCIKNYDKLAHLIAHKMAWSFQRQASVISIKMVNNIPLSIIGVWEKIIYYARRNCQIFLHARAPGGRGTCPSAHSWWRQWLWLIRYMLKIPKSKNLRANTSVKTN